MLGGLNQSEVWVKLCEGNTERESSSGTAQGQNTRVSAPSGTKDVDRCVQFRRIYLPGECATPAKLFDRLGRTYSRMLKNTLKENLHRDVKICLKASEWFSLRRCVIQVTQRAKRGLLSFVSTKNVLHFTKLISLPLVSGRVSVNVGSHPRLLC